MEVTNFILYMQQPAEMLKITPLIHSRELPRLLLIGTTQLRATHTTDMISFIHLLQVLQWLAFLQACLASFPAKAYHLLQIAHLVVAQAEYLIATQLQRLAKQNVRMVQHSANVQSAQVAR